MTDEQLQAIKARRDAKIYGFVGMDEGNLNLIRKSHIVLVGDESTTTLCRFEWWLFSCNEHLSGSEIAEQIRIDADGQICERCRKAFAKRYTQADTDIDALLAEVERLTAELATAREILEVWNMLQAGLDKGDTLFIESYYISRYEAIVHHRTSAGGTIIGPKHVSYVSKSTTLSDVLRKAFAPISTQRA